MTNLAISGLPHTTYLKQTKFPKSLFFTQEELREKLVSKISSLEKKTEVLQILIDDPSSSIFQRTVHPVPFFSKHPLADYPDPGPYPSSILPKWLSSKKRKWERNVKKILCFQPNLFSQTATLKYTRDYLNKDFTRIREELGPELALYIHNMSLRVISLLSLNKGAKKAFSIEEALSVFNGFEAKNISYEAAIFAENFLEWIYHNNPSSADCFHTEFTKIFSKHAEGLIEVYDTSKSFVTFWERYICEEPMSTLLLFIFQKLVENSTITNANGSDLSSKSMSRDLPSLKLEEFSLSEVDFLFQGLLSSRDLENSSHDWYYTKNLCEIYLAIEILKLEI